MAIDRIDARIVALLQADARMTYQQLGAGVGLSSPATYQRVRRLEEHGVITGYHARVNPAALGRPVCVGLMVEPGAAGDVERLEATWEAAPEVLECYRTAGGGYWIKLGLATIQDVERHVRAARTAGCSVRAEVVSTTVFERWTVSAEGLAADEASA